MGVAPVYKFDVMGIQFITIKFALKELKSRIGVFIKVGSVCT
jgi:hypothetical protein